MKKLSLLLLLSLPFACFAEACQSTLLVQTGKLRESDLIVRKIVDRSNSKECLTSYVSADATDRHSGPRSWRKFHVR